MLAHDFGASSHYEAGCIRPIDGLVHAVRKKLSGDFALCGAGRVETHLVGGFDGDAEDACPSCLAALAGEAAS